ncbi:drug/metabolite transporter (DMT)-like permease [Nocardia mexicana]|uniref:Drug/metabolite transporter (DMT)-like permease n=2 Tax=Nocardia mexicana TaxID=279262 RepID=A0A370HCB3_9NOCA|nr:drug/metabolite transporter (DMT)-like permease [Nocardia mexicana]
MLSALFVACWSSGFIGAKLGAADAPITTVLMWRFVPLAAVLVPLAHRFHRDRRIPGLGHRILLRHIVIGVLSQTGYLTTVYWAIARGVNTGTTALIDGLQPLAAAALVGPLLGVAVTGRQWAGLGLGVCGVVLVTASDAANASGVPWWAYLIPLIGMLSLIAATLVERRTPDRIPPPTSLTIQCCTSAAIFTGAALLTGTATPPAAGTFWLALAWLILLSTLGGYGLYWYLVAKLGVTQVNALMFLMAPVTAVWGALLFGESFTGVTAAGLAIGIAAVITVNYSGSKSPAAERSAATGTGSVEVAACR